MGLFENSNRYDEGDSARPDKNPEVGGNERRRRDPYRDPWKKSALDPYSDSGFNDLGGTGRYPQDPNRFDPEVQMQNAPSGFAKAALVCGIASVIFVSSGLSLFFGAFGILFALLSRRRKIPQMGAFGLGLSIAGIAIFVCIVSMSLSVLKANGTLDYIMQEVQETDFSDERSVGEMENNVLNRIMQGTE